MRGTPTPFSDPLSRRAEPLVADHRQQLQLLADFDFLVNNAGIGVYAPFADTTEKDFDELLNVHFKGVFFLTQELGARQITVNAVAPGATGTDFGGGGIRDDEQMRGTIAANTALGRVGEPDDIGGAIASLLTGDNRWVTGQRIEVSGGTRL